MVLVNEGPLVWTARREFIAIDGEGWRENGRKFFVSFSEMRGVDGGRGSCQGSNFFHLVDDGSHEEYLSPHSSHPKCPSGLHRKDFPTTTFLSFDQHVLSVL